ncbi:MAG: PDZ domain-containing protein [Saprospiraceae bacterium]|nr:PDZ domain-containing protein [Saprospiraceae bacterium]
MKTTRNLLLVTTLLLFPWCLAPLFSQQESNKKVVITKRTVDADGSESTETIIKKGAAAENFDVDKYIRENRADNTSVEVEVTGGDDERSIVINGPKSPKNSKNAPAKAKSYSITSGDYAPTQSKSPFLGVDEDSDEKADQPGLVVNVIRGSAADKAGLRDNDKILKLNNNAIDRWSDLTKFMRAAKVGDKVDIVYERYGKTYNAQATLISRDQVEKVETPDRGYLGVSDEDDEDENDAPGVEVSISEGSAAEKAGLMDGDVIFQLGEAPIADFEDISDFMAYTKPGDKVTIVYERNGKRQTTEATLTGNNNTWNVNLGNWDLGSSIRESLEDLDEDLGLNLNLKGNCTVNVRSKDACLGVYSDTYSEGDKAGSRINGFTDMSAAKEAGLQNGDLITAINGQKIESQEELWNEIAGHKVGDKVSVDIEREGKKQKVEVSLKACQDNSSRVQIFDGDGEQVRDFTSWNWNDNDQRNLRERSVITIRRGQGDAPKVNSVPAAQERSLKLNSFSAYPNPTMGQVTVEFNAEPIATTVSFYDLAGRQLFREELNAFGGRYNQQFDLSDYSKDTIIIQVQQGEKAYSEQLQVN